MSPQPIPQRVLVVDDDPMSRELLGVLLEAEGCAAELADSGESALDLIRHSIQRSEPAPELVLADVQLPGISGAALARKLRRACGPATLLIAMSGSQPPGEAISLFDSFLLKPFKIEQVAAAVQASKRQPDIAKPGSVRAKREKAATASGPVSAEVQAKSIAPHATAGKSASNRSMSTRTQEQETTATANPGDAATDLPMLNETIYRQLARSMPAEQLQEMYTMCVDDARKRIAGMRRLAAEHDATRFMREAHAIKGGCGMLGATELHRMAARLEANGPDPDPGAQNVNSLDELSAACDRLERMLGSRV